MAHYRRSGTSGLYLPTGGKGNMPVGKGKTVVMGDVLYWAENGELNIANRTSGRHVAKSPKSAWAIWRKLSAQVGTSTRPGIARDKQERREMEQALQDIEELIKMAEVQVEKRNEHIREIRRKAGLPDDPN